MKLGIKRERLGWGNEFALHLNGFAVEERERGRQRGEYALGGKEEEVTLWDSKMWTELEK